MDEDDSWKSLLPRTKKIIKSQQNKKSYTETEEEIISVSVDVLDQNDFTKLF